MNETLVVSETPVAALESISRAEVDMQISTARKYPRQLAAVKASMLSFATLDQETAESCFYTLPRGGKVIKGPSVRLAEIAVACYGNLRAGTRIIETVIDGPTPHVVVQAMAHDLEKNTAITMEKRRRITKKTSKPTIDEDDINLATNACTAIAFRDAVFKIIPGALIKPVYEQALMVAIGDAKTLTERRARAIESFGKMGVTQDRVLALLEKKAVVDVDVNDLEILFGLHTAIKDKDITIDEAFPIATQGIKPDVKGEATKEPVKTAAPAKEPVKTMTTGESTPFAKESKAAKEKKNKETTAAATDITNLMSGNEPAKEVSKEPEPKSTPEPEPPTATEATKPEPPAEDPANQNSIHADLVDFLDAKGVSTEDFMGWLHNTGRFRGAINMKVSELPAQLLTNLTMDTVAMGKCIKLYGKPVAATTPTA